MPHSDTKKLAAKEKAPHKLFLKATTANENSLHMSRMINVSLFTIVFLGLHNIVLEPAAPSSQIAWSVIAKCVIRVLQPLQNAHKTELISFL